jgi:hypothetical protein
MLCVVATESQLKMDQPAAGVMSEIAVVGPHCVHVAQSATASEASNDVGTNTNGQCAPSQRHRSQQVCPRSIDPECTERTNHWRLGLVGLQRGQVRGRALLRVSCHGAIFVLRVNHFELYGASGQLFVKKRNETKKECGGVGRPAEPGKRKRVARRRSKRNWDEGKRMGVSKSRRVIPALRGERPGVKFFRSPFQT